jgi:diaminopimelate epimerase
MKTGIIAGVKGIDYTLDFINTGVPHAVFFTDDVDDISVSLLGSAIRYHQVFKPAGTNVNFVQIINDSTIKVRTYERGVEAETLACGTGATASALMSAAAKGITGRPVKVKVPGGELMIDFKYEEGRFSDVWLIGPAVVTFKGEVLL